VARHSEWEIIGAPEIRDVDREARYFTPWKVTPHAELMRLTEPPLDCSRTLCSRRRWTISRPS
jgi:hypothetical protein